MLVFRKHHDLFDWQLAFGPIRRAHPDLTFSFGRQDDRHCLGVNRPDDRVRHGSQNALDKVRIKNWRLSCLSNAAQAPAMLSSFEEFLQTRHT